MSAAAYARGWRAIVLPRLRILVLLSGAMAIAGALGAWFWVFDLLSHFIAWYALLSLLLALLLSGYRDYRWAAAAITLAILQAAQPLAWYLPAARGATEGPRCRVLLANVLSSNHDSAAFLRLVDETDPDIICVQEVTGRWADALETLETRYPTRLLAPREDNFGIAVFSRMPGGDPALVFQRDHGVPAIEMVFQLGDSSVRLLNIHALPPLGKTLAARRNAQLDAAAAWVNSAGGPAVLIGDLNITMYSPVYRRFARAANLRNAREGHGAAGTWPAWLPIMRLPIDHVLLHGKIESVSCNAIKNGASDHRSLLVDLVAE
ncbi:MAG: endonuclease/exonuclease/phosphatase family protein [Candidatus Hydrogenedentes bacterium]|nr:endonuclease/exonuclease/phosphatase family protein [Candidatus Hydrogenedentota bacterium]